MLGGRISSLLHCLNVSFDRVERRLSTRHEILNEARRAPLRNIQNVIKNQDLAIDVRAGSDSNDRYFSLIGNCLPDFIRNAFEQQQVCSCFLQFPGALDHLFGLFGFPALHFKPADFVHRLWP